MTRRLPRSYLADLRAPATQRTTPAVAASITPVTPSRRSTAASARPKNVEDDIFGDFEHTPAPRLAAFDGLGRVSQTLDDRVFAVLRQALRSADRAD